MNRLILFVILITFLGSGCKNSDVKPCSVEITRTDINHLSDEDAFVIVYATVINPNPVAIRLSQLKSQLIVADKKAGTSTVDESLKLSPNIPTQITISFFIRYAEIHQNAVNAIQMATDHLTCQIKGSGVMTGSEEDITFSFESNEFE